METIKTYKGWKGDIDSYLKVGDLVDDEMVEHFINVLPPLTLTSTMVQTSEPYDHVLVDGKVKGTYYTFIKTTEGWSYAGHCIRGNTHNIEN